jgi:AbrB family looped-hinge helix DNA binding protein
MKTTVSSKGQIVLPAELRQQDGIEAGQEFEVERRDRGEYRLVRRTAPPNDGVVDWLLACPDKGFFVPIESESTDTLPVTPAIPRTSSMASTTALKGASWATDVQLVRRSFRNWYQARYAHVFAKFRCVRA